MVQWEDGVEEAFKRKKNKYFDLAAEASQKDWKTSIFPVEVGCKGFVFYHQPVKEGRSEGMLPPTGYQSHIKCSGKKQQLALDKAK